MLGYSFLVLEFCLENVPGQRIAIHQLFSTVKEPDVKHIFFLYFRWPFVFLVHENYFLEFLDLLPLINVVYYNFFMVHVDYLYFKVDLGTEGMNARIVVGIIIFLAN